MPKAYAQMWLALASERGRRKDENKAVEDEKDGEGTIWTV